MTLRSTGERGRRLQDLADTQGISTHEAVVRAIEALTRNHAVIDGTTRRVRVATRCFLLIDGDDLARPHLRPARSSSGPLCWVTVR